MPPTQPSMYLQTWWMEMAGAMEVAGILGVLELSRQGADVTPSRCCYIFLELVDTPTISLNGTSVAHHNLWISPGPNVNVKVGPLMQVHNLVLLSLDGCSRVPT